MGSDKNQYLSAYVCVAKANQSFASTVEDETEV